MTIFKQQDFKKSSENLIIFFSGFGSAPSHFELFFANNKTQEVGKNFDIIMCYDYVDFTKQKTQMQDIINTTKNYANTYLIAWSMGVFVASVLLSDFAKNNGLDLGRIFTQKIAINGTNIGIHSTQGIPPKIFSYTAKNFNQDAFRSALFDTNKVISQDKNTQDFIADFALPKDTQRLKNELESLQHLQTNTSLDFMQNVIWDKAIISKADKIFPTHSCEIFFAQNPHKNHTKIIYTNAPHFAFIGFKNWQEIIAINH